MDLWKSLEGMLCVELTSAVPTDMLTAVNHQGIMLYHVTYLSDLSILANIRRADYKSLALFLEKRGESLKVRSRKGIYWTLKLLLHRPVLLIGILLYLLLAVFLPTRVLFMEVEGNRAVSTQRILEKAEVCGIYFGASRRDVRSEKVKNSLLAAIPELQWAGVNTVGCTAVISVKERTNTDREESAGGVTSIVASRDGVICYSAVTQGNLVCKVGQAVKKGQVLVSGYTDCGLTIQATRAEAEIFAKTLRSVSAITPINMPAHGEILKVDSQYSLIIGKKLIKLSQDSGISPGRCVRMYKRYTLALPGGFELPVSLIKEEQVYFACNLSVDATDCNYSWMDGYLDDYLKSQMVAGQILKSGLSSELQDDIYKLSGEYSCVEMIGEIRKEEIIDHNGESN